MKIIFIGSSGSLSLIPFQALIESGHHVCAVAFDDDNNSHFNIIQPDSIQSLAFNHSIPLIKLNKNYQAAANQIQKYKPDIILVSCYAHRLPHSILSLASKGSINIHPSLLPSFRGPDPLFWQFREGISNFGITLHHITADFDAGDIISQKTVLIEDGISANEATKKLAFVARSLMLVTLDHMENDQLYAEAQNNKLSSYQSYPTEADYTISSMWTAKRIYNFIKAYKGENVIFICDPGMDNIKISEAYSYQDEPYKDMNGKTEMLREGIIMFACKEGYIQCQLKMD